MSNISMNIIKGHPQMSNIFYEYINLKGHPKMS